MPRAAPRNEQDLSEFMTACARAMTGAAADKSLSFFFDYRGPSFAVRDEAAPLQRLVEPLVRDAVDRLSTGCVFFSVDVIPHPPDRATVLVQVARTGRPASELVVNRLINATRPAVPDARAGSNRDSPEGRARRACEELGGSLIVGDLPGEGHVVRADVLIPCRPQEDDLTIAIEQGLVAWLVGDPPVVFESLVRRLHRLGWKVCVIPSVSLARTHLRDGGARPHPPDIVVGAERYKVDLDEFADFTTPLPPSTACFATVLEASRSRLDPLGFFGRVQAFANPFSPRELHQLTVCALAKQGKRLRMPSNLTAALERRPRALLVEDNVVNQLLSTEILQLFGFEVDVANNGLEAVRHCLRDLPAIVLMDLDMPVMDGLDATRQLRDLQRRGTLPYIPIVATTAKSSDDDRAQARQAGMDGFVPKPLDIAQLQQEIRRALQQAPDTPPNAPDNGSFR